MLNLSKDDMKKIGSAVERAESKTSGEIATAMIKESYNYAIYELMFAVIIGFLYFVIMMFFAGNIEQLLQGKFWDYSVNYLIMFYGFSIFIIITIFYFIGNISSIDRLIVPKKIRQQKVQERAIRYFMESGVYNTKDRIGILIFISIVDNIIKGIKQKEIAIHLTESIAECGDLLSEHFPIQANDKNELTDDIEILEK